MRKLRYNVATSLDGFIAAEDGGYDWIVEDPTVDFGALFEQFDAFVMGRKTYETLQAQGEQNPLRGRRLVVATRTLAATSEPDTLFVGEGIETAVADLKREPGKDVWLFGGGELARCLFDAGLVDTVELAVMPVLLGAGRPALPAGGRVPLALESTLPRDSGIVQLSYAVRRESAGGSLSGEA